MGKKTRLVRCNISSTSDFFTLKIWFLDIGKSKVCSVGMVYFLASKITAFVDNELKEFLQLSHHRDLHIYLGYRLLLILE